MTPLTDVDFRNLGQLLWGSDGYTSSSEQFPASLWIDRLRLVRPELVNVEYETLERAWGALLSTALQGYVNPHVRNSSVDLAMARRNEARIVNAVIAGEPVPHPAELERGPTKNPYNQ